MGVVPFNVRTYGGRIKPAITLEQKVCAQSPTYVYFITSFPMYWHHTRTLLLPLAFENGVEHTHGVTDGQTDYRNPPCACMARVNDRFGTPLSCEMVRLSCKVSHSNAT